MTLEQRMEWARVSVTNTDCLAAIVASHGCPGRTLVGEDGVENAWLLAQHADAQLDRQREFLVALRAAVEAGDASPRHLAYVSDRVAMNEGRPQRYGTQIAAIEDGQVLPWPIDSAGDLDERRAEAGLEPFTEYVERWRGRVS
jgi:hypothetical protein